ncbi:MAG: MMPL family transporter [Clostridia bacterium]|nr:MMPL family transporter [Clostridia bacterium]
MISKISVFIAKHPKIILLIAIILLVPSVFGFIFTRVNYDILSYLPKELESVEAQEVLTNVFENASNAILMIDNMESKDILKIKEDIKKIDGVASVLWVDDIADISIPKEMLPDVLSGIFYSQDLSSTMMIINFKSSTASEETLQAIRDIRSVMNRQCFLSGLATIMVDTRILTEEQVPLFASVAIVLALLVLSATMSSWVLPLILLVSLGIAVIYNMGTNFFFGEISFITQSIAAILQLGVTMDYSVFLVDRFEEERSHYPDSVSAMAEAIRSTFSAVLGSSLTTIFGFLALCFMSLTLGVDIGIVMAKGVLIGIVSVVTVLPAFVLLFEKYITRFRHRSLVPSFRRINSFSVKHKKLLTVAFVVLFVPMAIFSSMPEKDYDMVKSLPQDIDSVASLDKLKNEFNMATTHFAVFDAETDVAQTSKMLEEINALDGITDVIALNSFIGPAISESILPQAILDICQKEGLQMMMINSSFPGASDECNNQVEQLKAVLKKYDPDSLLTGEGVMTKDLIDVTDRDFKVTNIISIVAMIILIAIIFRSASVPLILVAMIELSIFINQAISFFTGSSIPFIAPTVVSCVQLGATVDYAILMTTRFKEELTLGHDKKTAVMNAATSSCKSIFQSALVFFAATFGVYVVCDIEMIKSICLLLARGSIISALVIMIILPAVLYLSEGLISKTTLKWKTKGGVGNEN